jgi:putative transposase
VATGGIDSGDIRDLTIESVERRFGLVNQMPPLEWLSDNGSPYTARETRALAHEIDLCGAANRMRKSASIRMRECRRMRDGRRA